MLFRFLMVWVALSTAAPAQLLTNLRVKFNTTPRHVEVYQVVDDSSAPAFLGRSGEEIRLPDSSEGKRIRVRFGWHGYLDPQELVVPLKEAAMAPAFPNQPQAVRLPLPVRISYEWSQRWLYLVALGLALAVAIPAAVVHRRRSQGQEELCQRARRLEDLQLSGDESDPRLLQKVGRYRLIKRLGTGGMAVVYRALPDESLDEKGAVAVKLIRTEEAQSIEFRKRFQREVEVCTKLVHPNIVSVLDHGDHDGCLYLVMEVIPGDTLRKRLSPNGLPLKEAGKLLEGIFTAVQYAHSKGVVHRDLKPDNIMVTGAGRVVVMDFGLARRHDFSTVTATGSILGTPAYMAPEQIQGGSIEASIDQYALGMIVYEMLTGRIAFDIQDPVQLILKHLTEPPLPPGRHRRGLPPGIDAVVLRMLEKDARDRFADVQAAARALLPLLR